MTSEIKETLEYLNEFINDKEEITKYGCELSVKKAKHLLDYIAKLEEESKRLKNIINELEKELNRGYRDLYPHELVPGRELITNILNYLQELMEDK